MRQGCKPDRICLAGHQGVEDRPAALSEHVGEFCIDLEVGVLQHLVNALGMTAPFTHQLLARAQKVAQFLRLTVRDEARPDQSVRQEFRQPRGVIDVGLATGHVLHVRGIRQNQLELAVRQHVPYGSPVHASGLHRHVRAVVRQQPVRQHQKSCRCRGKGLHLCRHSVFLGKPHRGHDRLLVNVKSSAT
jgi:hypothetical protein